MKLNADRVTLEKTMTDGKTYLLENVYPLKSGRFRVAVWAAQASANDSPFYSTIHNNLDDALSDYKRFTDLV